MQIIALSALLVLTGALVWGWPLIGADNPVYGLTVACGTFAIGPLLGGPLARAVPRRWFRVHPGERRVHRAVGVVAFGWLLDRSGWDRAVAHPMRPFDGTRTDLPKLEVHLHRNVSAHTAGFLIHVVFAVAALLTGHLWGTAWILLPGVLIHLYPVLLQRSIALRVQPLLDRITPRNGW